MVAPRGVACVLVFLLAGCADQRLHAKPADDAGCPEAPTPTLVRSEPSCRVVDPAPVVADPWHVAPLWTYTDSPDGDSEAPPLVGYLADTDGDGVHGLGDTPVVVLGGKSAVAALDGATGAVRWRWERGDETIIDAGLAIADLDADGAPEVVTVVLGNQADDWPLWAVALDGEDGSERWRAMVGSWSTRSTLAVHVADLEGDGTPEILMPGHVLSGSNGQTLAQIPSSGFDYSNGLVTADLDGDGRQEILTEGAVFDLDLTELWNARSASILRYHTPVVLQADADLEPEVVWLSTGFTVWNHDGTPTGVVVDLPGTLMALPPCAADIDGDGATELVEPTWSPEKWSLEAFRLDGSQVWSREIEIKLWETERFGGCAAFDLDGDGAAEVLFSNHDHLMVVDGRTGATLAEYPAGAPTGATTHPTVADLDGDGHAEILVPGEDPDPSLTVLRHDGAGWAAAGAGWGVTAYAVTNSTANGYVPPRPAPWWLLDNTWRSPPSGADVPLPDLAVEVEGACGPAASVRIRVANPGTGTAPAGVVLVVEEGGVEIGRVVLPEILPATALDGVVVALPEGTGDRVRVVVDVDQAVAECDEANNAWEGEWR